jgi:hypothetical protein
MALSCLEDCAQAGGSAKGAAKAPLGPPVVLRCAAAAVTGAALTVGVRQQFALPFAGEFPAEMGVCVDRSALLLWVLLSRERSAGRDCALFRESRNAVTGGPSGHRPETAGLRSAGVAARAGDPGCPGLPPRWRVRGTRCWARWPGTPLSRHGVGQRLARFGCQLGVDAAEAMRWVSPVREATPSLR